MGSEVDNEVPDLPDTGAVFTFGGSGFADNLPSHFFIRNDPIIDLACGEEHTMVVCQNGRLFGFGGNEFGQIGLGHKNAVVKPSCVKSLKPEKVKLIACGQRHTIACTECNNLYSWGDNNEGQLGTGENEVEEDTFLPKRCDEKVEFKGYIKQLAAGSAHSAALTKDGSVYVWGSNLLGQLGLGDGVKKMRSPSLLPLRDNIVQIACGFYHTLLLSDQGQIFVFGEGNGGKLGLGGNNSVPLPIPLSLEDLSCRVIGISAGGQHSMALTEDGDVYAWGENEYQQLGFPLEEYNQINRPTVVSFLRNFVVKQIICGQHHSAFITDKNELYVCGDTRYGKLCGDVEFAVSSPKIRSAIPFKVSKFKGFKVEKVACGGRQTMVLAYPEKYIDTVIPNEFSNHKVVSSSDQHNGRDFSNNNLELPSHDEIISPPPARTSQSPLTIPITNNIDKTSTQTIDHSSNISPECSIPPPKNKSSRTPSPNNLLNQTQIHNAKNNELKNNLEIADVVSDDSASSSSNTEETVSTKLISYNIYFDDCKGDKDSLEKNDTPRINTLRNNYFQENPPLKVVYKNKQVHHKFCYSMDPDNVIEETADKNSFNNYCCNENTNDINDEINEYNDFDDESNDDDDDDDNDDVEDEDDNNLLSNGNNNNDNYTSNYCVNECYRNRFNQFEGIDTIEEIPEDCDFVERSSTDDNKTNERCHCSNFLNDHNHFRFNKLDTSIKQYLMNNTDSNVHTMPRILCFYQNSTDSPTYPKYRREIDMNGLCCEGNKTRQTEQQKSRRRITEQWLDDNQNESKRKDRNKSKQSKLHVYDIKLRCKDNGDVCNRGFRKGGGISQRTEMNPQRNGSFFQFRTIKGKINKTNHVDSPSERTIHSNSSESVENKTSSPKGGKSDSMLSRIFGSKKGTKSSNNELNKVANGSSNGVQDGAISENNKERNVSPDELRNHPQNSGVSPDGSNRGQHKNSKVCALL